MRGFVLTNTEQEIIKALLAEIGITDYEVVPYAREGGDLPGSSYPSEITSFSGFIVTAEKIYELWFDWYEEHYTLGQEKGCWEETSLEALENDKRLYAFLKEMQERLRKRKLHLELP